MKPFIELAKQIQDFSEGKKVLYIANTGNFGDALIRYGTLKFFKHFEINYKEIVFKKYKNRYLSALRILIYRFFYSKAIYGGGGAWCKIWYHSVNRVKLLSLLRFRTFVLPSTYEFEYKVNRVKFTSRDKYQSLQNMPQTQYFPDMALFIGDEFSSNTITKNKFGLFFREDPESSGQFDLPDGNFDLSLTGDEYSNVEKFFESIKEFEEIHTDRLHVAIAAYLINKKFTLYPGSYFKNEALFKSSLHSPVSNFSKDYSQIKNLSFKN